MIAWEFFKAIFSEKNLKETYYSHVIYSGATGLDGTNHANFQKHIEEEIATILKKVYKGTYRPTPYKIKLQSKGPDKNPRVISIPTIRDRLVLRALNDYTNLIFGDIAKTPIPHKTIGLTKESINKKIYDTFIRIDIKNFFDSINHEDILDIIEKTTSREEITSLFERAIKTPTTSPGEKATNLRQIGIPQGLPVSNSLANIFLAGVDQHFNKKGIFYTRYVDDILILCQEKETKRLEQEIFESFKGKGLSVHTPETAPEKSLRGSINKSEFAFLGYLFREKGVSVRWESAQKFRESIISIFTAYKKGRTENINFLSWRLNIRITGCIFENKSKGWLFFFSEIEDEALLHGMDLFIEKTKYRFGYDIPTKKLSRTLYEAKYRRFTSPYIPNYDEYSIKEKREFLNKIVGITGTGAMTDSEVDQRFGGRISKEIKELEEDISPVGY